MSNVDVKNFLYAWCGRQQKRPEYEITTVNTKGQSRFKCEVRVLGFNYTGVGNSTSKKNAQTQSAQDFCQYLVRTGVMKKEDLPFQETRDSELSDTSLPATTIVTPPKQAAECAIPFYIDEFVHDTSLSFDRMSLPPSTVKQVTPQKIAASQTAINTTPQRVAIAPPPLDKTFPYNRGPPAAYLAAMPNEAAVLEGDFGAEIHGFWTIENAKSRLHGYIQKERVQTDYRYAETGPANNRTFFCEIGFFCKQIQKQIHAREHGATKQHASKKCALSLIRQLFHYGVIEAYTSQKKKKESPATTSFVVEVSDELKDRLAETCEMLGLQPVLDYDSDNPTSLVLAVENNQEPNELKPVASVSWSPPLHNWNPWTSCSIDKGPLATASLEAISQDLANEHFNRIKNDRDYQSSLSERKRLPIHDTKNEILQAIEMNQVIIVRGAAGSGKTTQIPQYILDHHMESKTAAHCNIICTQPRRISAVSVAERVASERCEALGVTTGYSVRFDSVFPRPYGGILYCTVGVLLRKLENGLRGVSHVVVDEIHERDVTTDLLLVLLKDMLKVNKELRVVLMSATIDESLFCEYFGSCPVKEIYGRTFPVTEYFLEDVVQLLKFSPTTSSKRKRKIADDDDEEDDDEIEDTDAEVTDVDCNRIVSQQYSAQTRDSMKQMSEKSVSFEIIESLISYIRTLNQPGAILIFLPGWNLIFGLLKHLREHPVIGSPQYRLLPLHSQIPREDQHRVFESVPAGVTKIIISTNIAESSITINDIVFVIDCCKVKQKTFMSRNNMTSYATVWASKANLEQRKGRAGRTKGGHCFYLVSRARYERLENHATPEMFHTPLHELALCIKLLGLGQIRDFLAKAIEPPPLDAVHEAEMGLIELQALDMNRELTPLGKILARLPVEPKLGKMIIMGCVFAVGDAVCTIAAATTFPEPFLRDGKNLRMMHKNLAGRRQSDHVALLNAFQQYQGALVNGQEAEREFCERKCLNMSIMRMTMKARNQLKDILRLSGFPEECSLEVSYETNGPDARLDIITSLLCQALYPNVCYHVEKRKLVTAGGKIALINKNSVNCGVTAFPSPFFIFGEKIKSGAVSAKQMTMVTPFQLLLFASDKVETIPGTTERPVVCLDNWITLSMVPEVAAIVVSLRLALNMILKISTKNPSEIVKTHELEQLTSMVVMLADQECNHVVYTKLSTNDTILQKHTASIPHSSSSEEQFEPAAKRHAITVELQNTIAQRPPMTFENKNFIPFNFSNQQQQPQIQKPNDANRVRNYSSKYEAPARYFDAKKSNNFKSRGSSHFRGGNNKPYRGSSRGRDRGRFNGHWNTK